MLIRKAVGVNLEQSVIITLNISGVQRVKKKNTHKKTHASVVTLWLCWSFPSVFLFREHARLTPTYARAALHFSHSVPLPKHSLTFMSSSVQLISEQNLLRARDTTASFWETAAILIPSRKSIHELIVEHVLQINLSLLPQHWRQHVCSYLPAAQLE